MRRVARGALVALLAAPVSVGIAVSQPGTAHACSCVYVTDGSQAAENIADFAGGDGAVFVGTPVTERHDQGTLYYEFDVREVFRGDIGSETTVSTPDSSPACGTSFDLKEEYLVFVSTYETQGAPWSVNGCSATTLSSNQLTRSATVARFGEPRTVANVERPAAEPAATSEPPETDRNVTTWVGLGVVLLIVAVAVASTVRCRRR